MLYSQKLQIENNCNRILIKTYFSNCDYLQKVKSHRQYFDVLQVIIMSIE